MATPLGRMAAFGNQKGGVGKSTTCINAGAALARQGRKVCLVDVDPNRGLSKYFSVPDEGYYSSFELFTGACSAKDALLVDEFDGVLNGEETKIKLPENLAVVPSSRELEGLQQHAEKSRGLRPEQLFSAAMDELTAEFDYVFVDTAPNLTRSTVIAYNTVPWFVLTATPGKTAIDSLTDAVSDLIEVKKYGAAGRLLGVALTLIDMRTKLSRSIVDFVRDEFIADLPDGKKVSLQFENFISKAIAVDEAPFVAQTIFDYQPNCKACAEYEALAEEMEKRFDKFESMFEAEPQREKPSLQLVANE